MRSSRGNGSTKRNHNSDNSGDKGNASTKKPKPSHRKGASTLKTPLDKTSDWKKDLSRNSSGQFTSQLYPDQKVIYKDTSQPKADWIDACITQIWYNKNEFEKRPCKFVIQISYVGKDGSDCLIDIPSYGSNSHPKGIKYSYEKCIRKPQKLLDTLRGKDKSRANIYRSIVGLMQFNTLKTWHNHPDFKTFANEFDFGLLFQHLASNTSSHCFYDIILSIEKDDTAKSMFNHAANESDAYEDVLKVMAYMVGIFVTIEMNCLNGKTSPFKTH